MLGNQEKTLVYCVVRKLLNFLFFSFYFHHALRFHCNRFFFSNVFLVLFFPSSSSSLFVLIVFFTFERILIFALQVRLNDDGDEDALVALDNFVPALGRRIVW